MKTRSTSYLTTLIATTLLTTACSQSTTYKGGADPGPTTPDIVAVTPTPSCTEDGKTLQLNCPALPATNANGSFNTTNTTTRVLDYDIFSWNSFIAMNWPAKEPSTINNQRGFPDLSKSFATARPGDLTVWETYKEKREIFHANPFTGAPVANPQVAAWNSAPSYGPSTHPVPLCPNASALSNSFERHIANNSSKFNTLDETAEVSSEARETNTVLCRGHSANCNVQGSPVGPRVWLNRGGNSYPVIYEVKVNWDFYNYLDNFRLGNSSKKLWIQANARTAAAAGKIRLPARTSGPRTPQKPGSGFHLGGVVAIPVYGPNHIVANYTTSHCLNLYNSISTSSNITPCPEGSVHLKAAWVPLEAPSDKYHTAMAYHYRDYTPAMNQPGYPSANKCKAPGYYGLVGLHIIQRIHQSNQNKSTPHGGTFIYSTWEHTGNDAANFTYANLYPTTSPTPIAYPSVTGSNSPADAIPLKRAYAPLTSTENANRQVHTALGCSSNPNASVWCNYKLIGTQHIAVDGPPAGFNIASPPTALPGTPQPGLEKPAGQPYFLANLVLESNVGLQQFLGLPPNVQPIDHFKHPRVPPGGNHSTSRMSGNPHGIVDNPSATSYTRTGKNVALRIAPRTVPAYVHANSTYKRLIKRYIEIYNSPGGTNTGKKIGAYNMGGCMGCHGVAQISGYSFSFVLLGNQAGAAPDTLTHVDIPPPPPTP